MGPFELADMVGIDVLVGPPMEGVYQQTGWKDTSRLRILKRWFELGYTGEKRARLLSGVWTKADTLCPTILREFDFKPKKRLGQHFLVDETVLQVFYLLPNSAPARL